MSKFKDLGLNQAFADALDKVGYTDPTPIQEQAIPELLKGSDVIGQAQTGTGKTAAFGLPMLQSLIPDRREVQAIVLTPTRELCIQVAQSLRAYGAIAGIDVLATFGGAPIRQQMDRLKSGPQVVVGTVGRVLDLNSRHALMFHDARFVVLDEADEMLDLGFLEDVETILKKTPRGRQTALFSATMPPAIAKLAEVHMHDPVTIKVKAPTLTIDTVEHFQKKTTKSDKIDAIIEVLEAEKPTQAIVFARTKIGVDRLARDLDRRKPNLRVRALHGDMSQGSRDGVMIAFKDNRVPVLVATDIAARGLDVQNVTHVINYDLPNSAEIYTHRIGRTGRAGRGGRAITLVEPRDKEDFVAIEKHINVQIPEWSASSVGKKPAAVKTSGGDSAEKAAADKPAAGERRPRRRAAKPDDDAAAATENLVEIDAGDAEPPTHEVEPAEVPQASEDLVEIDAGGVTVPEAEATAEPEEEAVKTPFTWPGQAPAEPEAEADDQPASDSSNDLEVEAEAEAEAEEPVAEAEAEAELEAEAEAGPEAEAEAEPEERELRRPRHVKPDQHELDGDFSLVIVTGGAAAGVEPADVIELVTANSDLTGSDIRRVRVLSRFTLLRVPTDRAADVAGTIDGKSMRGNAVIADAVVREAASGAES